MSSRQVPNWIERDSEKMKRSTSQCLSMYQKCITKMPSFVVTFSPFNFHSLPHTHFYQLEHGDDDNLEFFKQNFIFLLSHSETLIASALVFQMKNSEEEEEKFCSFFTTVFCCYFLFFSLASRRSYSGQQIVNDAAFCLRLFFYFFVFFFLVPLIYWAPKKKPNRKESERSLDNNAHTQYQRANSFLIFTFNHRIVYHHVNLIEFSDRKMWQTVDQGKARGGKNWRTTFIWIWWHLMDISQVNWKKGYVGLSGCALPCRCFVVFPISLNRRSGNKSMLMLIIMHIFPQKCQFPQSRLLHRIRKTVM